jgi:hypothetical protein
MMATVAAMVLAVVAALVVISDDRAENRARQAPDVGETHLGDLLDP